MLDKLVSTWAIHIIYLLYFNRPWVLRLLGIHRRTETGTPPTVPLNPTNHTQRTIATDRMKPTGPRQRRRRLRQLHLCPTPKRCMATPPHSTTPSTSQSTHLVLGTLRTLIQNPVPQSQAEPYPKGRPPDNTRQWVLRHTSRANSHTNIKNGSGCTLVLAATHKQLL